MDNNKVIFKFPDGEERIIRGRHFRGLKFRGRRPIKAIVVGLVPTAELTKSIEMVLDPRYYKEVYYVENQEEVKYFEMYDLLGAL